MSRNDFGLRFGEQAQYFGNVPDGRQALANGCLLYTSPSPRDVEESRMPSSA